MPESSIRRWRWAPLSDGSATSIPSSARAGAVHSQQALERRGGRIRLAALQVEQLAVEPVAQRPPHVLLDQPAGEVA